MLSSRSIQAIVGIVLAGSLVVNAYAFFAYLGSGKSFPPKSNRNHSVNGPPVRKVKPIKNKTILGVFDPNLTDGRRAFERALDLDVAVIVLFQQWAGDYTNFPVSWADEARKQGKVPFITWEPWEYSTSDFDQPKFRLSSIAAGKHDSYIRRWLSEARDWRGPVFVRFAHEMNGNWYPWGSHVNEPQDYVAAWRHIADLSDELAVDNVAWVWSPNELISGENLDPLYPGPDYVDWIGVSGFNWPELEPWQKWRSFSQIYDETLAQVKKYNKPIIIAEIGAAESRRADRQTRAAWITETLDQVKKNDPPISMFIWFNESGEVNGKIYDWRIDSSPESIEAMKKGFDDPAFVSNLR